MFLRLFQADCANGQLAHQQLSFTFLPNYDSTMNTTLRRALEVLNASVNVSTGLSHPSDMDKAKSMFKILHENKEVLLKAGICAWAEANGWKPDDADELGSLAQQIGEGKKVQIKQGWWGNEAYARWANTEQDS